MRVFVKWVQGGGDAGTVDLNGDDSVDTVRAKVAEATNTHTSLQRLIYRGVVLQESDGKTVRDYGLGIDEDLRLAVLPGPRVVKLDVGGERITTTLETLLKVEGSLIARMFDGLVHPRHGGGGAGLPHKEIMASHQNEIIL